MPQQIGCYDVKLSFVHKIPILTFRVLENNLSNSKSDCVLQAWVLTATISNCCIVYFK